MRVVRASGQCQSCNSPGFDPSILQYREIWGAADDAVLNNVQKTKKWKNPPLKKSLCPSLTWPTYAAHPLFHLMSRPNRFLCLSRPLTHSFCSSLISVSISHDSRLTTRLRKCACQWTNYLYRNQTLICRLFLKIDQKRYLAAGVYLSEALFGC